MNNGFVFSLEALLSLLLLASILLVPQIQYENRLSELLIFQKENDLLKIWGAQQKFSLDEMRMDFELAFPEKNGEIRIGLESELVGGKGKKAVCSEALFFTEEMSFTNISICVFD